MFTVADWSDSLPFDLALIGSGPAAVAALHGLGSSRRVAVVTGATGFAAEAGRLHPRIRAVSVENGEPAGLAECIANASEPSQALFSTATVGGLATYWGQQVVHYSANDPWPHDIFGDFSSYQDACRTIEALFTVVGGDPVDIGSDFERIRVTTPRLLTGSRQQPAAGLGAMRHAFRCAVQAVDAHIITARAQRISRANTRWLIQLDDGRKLFAQRILLAAGVIGDAQLLLRSFSDLASFRFSDHSPWMVYMIGLRRLLRARPPDAAKHFNALAIEQIYNDCCVMFASVYDMGRADLNLLLASVIGRTVRFVRGWPTPPGASLINPVQVWTPHTYDTVEVTRSGTVLATRPVQLPTQDIVLRNMLSQLVSARGRKLKVTRTQPARGFHYHNLQFRDGKSCYLGINDLLQDRSAGAVLCVDAAGLGMIGCRPHTLTAMAAAWSIAAQLS